MKNKYISISFICLISSVSLLFLSSCSIDPAINNSPNGISIASLKTQEGQFGLVVALQTGTGEFYCGDRSRMSSIFTWQMSAVKGLGRPQPITWNSYDLSLDGPVSDMWLVGFKTVRIANDILKYSVETDFGASNIGIRATLKGMAETYKAIVLGELAAYYGSIPITQDGFNTNPFVSQTDAYAEVQRLLDDAIIQFGNSAPIKQDLNYGGDKAKWISTCNSLKARYFLHLKNYSSALSSAKNGITDSKMSLNAMFTDAAGEQGPWAHWAKDESGEPIRGEKTFVDLLQKEAGDKRLSEYFTPNFNTTFFGNPAHKQVVTDTNATKGTNIVSLKKYAEYADDIPLISGNENTLIIAECEARVGALPNAVKAVNSIRVNAGLNDMNSGDVSDKNKVITEILTQKHLSLFLEGQTYTDMRRTGTLPELAVPKRFLYPLVETNSNKTTCPKDNDALVSAILP
ncbi:MAG: SusD/RagB family nutrient-binding outer membrane lipoprotein [Chlorobiota bacterium]|nr:SusD/RagB family nutrient-binding outer membrane lipoprotein [Chlorobiota bacterium]QQS67415.1 MAG: SusD/RagB family nutrient-binding outer membrane lipoprotein [Chlorobiota bacterium]